jgi:uncharacterized protein YukE
MTMTTFDKQERGQIDEICTRLTSTYADLVESIDAYNEAIRGLFAQHIQSALDAYNEAVSDANSLAEDLGAEMQTYFDEKSEKWQQGDKGQEYQEWIYEWETELQPYQLSEPDGIDYSDLEDHAETFGYRKQAAQAGAE